MELQARQLFMLALLFEPQSTLGMQEKVEMFLELYGNTHVRARDCHFVSFNSRHFCFALLGATAGFAVHYSCEANTQQAFRRLSRTSIALPPPSQK
jgi:hypothetical protein